MSNFFKGVVMTSRNGWTVIDDSKVVHIWEGKDEDGEICTVEVNPDYYADNGTPIDSNGDDMIYIRTEININ